MGSLQRRNAYVLGALLIAAAPFGPRACAGVALGGAFSIVNLQLLERSVSRLLGSAAEPSGTALRLLLHLRLALLFVLVAVVLLRTRVQPVPFAVGLSSSVPAVLWHGWRNREP